MLRQVCRPRARAEAILFLKGKKEWIEYEGGEQEQQPVKKVKARVKKKKTQKTNTMAHSAIVFEDTFTVKSVVRWRL